MSKLDRDNKVWGAEKQAVCQLMMLYDAMLSNRL